MAFALGHPRFGQARISAELARDKRGGILISPNGVRRVLKRHGLCTRAKRLGLVVGYAAPPEPDRQAEAEPERRLEAGNPGDLVQFDCFRIGRRPGGTIVTEAMASQSANSRPVEWPPFPRVWPPADAHRRRLDGDGSHAVRRVSTAWPVQGGALRCGPWAAGPQSVPQRMYAARTAVVCRPTNRRPPFRDRRIVG